MKLTVMLADPTGYVKAVIFGEKFAHSRVEGRSVAVKDYISTKMVTSKSWQKRKFSG